MFIRVRRRRIVWQYGHTDVPGRAPGYLNTPDGMAFLSAPEIDANPMLRRLAASATVRRPVAVPSERVAQSPKLTGCAASFSLPAAVEREVAVKTGMGIVIADGLDSAQQSTNGVYLLDPQTGSLRRLGFGPEPFHDGAAAAFGHRLFVFGGGAATSSSAVQAFDLRTHHAAVVAHLARPTFGPGRRNNQPSRLRRRRLRRHDTAPRNLPHLRRRPFRPRRRLPLGPRYPAVSAANGDLFIAGGVSARGPSSAVYRFDTGTRHVSTVGPLAVASAHAMAVTVGSGIEVPGGSLEVSARIDTKTLVVEPTGGRLDDANGAVVGGRASFLLGGDVAGRTVGTVWEIRAQ